MSFVTTVLDISKVLKLAMDENTPRIEGGITPREVRFAKALDAVLTALDTAPAQTNLEGVRQLVRAAIESVK